MANKWIVVAVSGGFDPPHVGHLRHFKMAKQLGNIVKLIVLLNSDEWLMRKKGYIFMPFEERKEIIENFRCVDVVLPVNDSDDTVAEGLRMVKPTIFAKGGDRDRAHMPKEELKVCDELGIKLVFHVHDPFKVHLSSSEMVRDACQKLRGMMK